MAGRLCKAVLRGSSGARRWRRLCLWHLFQLPTSFGVRGGAERASCWLAITPPLPAGGAALEPGAFPLRPSLYLVPASSNKDRQLSLAGAAEGS